MALLQLGCTVLIFREKSSELKEVFDLVDKTTLIRIGFIHTLYNLFLIYLVHTIVDVLDKDRCFVSDILDFIIQFLIFDFLQKLIDFFEGFIQNVSFSE